MSFKEPGLTQKEKMEQTEEKQRSSSTVPLQDLQDIRGRVPYITQNISNFKQLFQMKHSKPSPPSSPSEVSLQKVNMMSPQSTDIYHSKDQIKPELPAHYCSLKYLVEIHIQQRIQEGSLRFSPKNLAIDINPANKSLYTVRVNPGQTGSRISPEHHRKTSDGGLWCKTLMPKKRKWSADSLSRFYIPLSLRHYLGVPEQAVLDERTG